MLLVVPYNADVPMERLPVMNWLMIGITCIVSLVVPKLYPQKPKPKPPALVQLEAKIQHGKPLTPGEVERMARLDKEYQKNCYEPNPLAHDPQNFRIWQLITSVFLHNDLVHLFFNMIFLFAFGNAINAKLGHGWYLLAYLLLAVAEGVGWLLFGPGPAIGASGVVMGFMGMFLVLYPRNDINFFYWYWWFPVINFGFYAISAIWVILFFLAGDLIGVLWSKNSMVAYASHLSGGLAGIMGGIAVLLTGWITSDTDEENILQVLSLQPKRAKPMDKVIGQWQKRKV
jgi:membrane associated rhomboid family serine protease